MTHMSVRITETRSPLTTAHLRAFIYGNSMKPGRPDVLRHAPTAIARALADLSSEEAARCLALLPAGAQIAVVARLDPATRTRLERECRDWDGVVPILRAQQVSVAQNDPVGQMSPVGRI